MKILKLTDHQYLILHGQVNRIINRFCNDDNTTATLRRIEKRFYRRETK